MDVTDISSCCYGSQPSVALSKLMSYNESQLSASAITGLGQVQSLCKHQLVGKCTHTCQLSLVSAAGHGFARWYYHVMKKRKPITLRLRHVHLHKAIMYSFSSAPHPTNAPRYKAPTGKGTAACITETCCDTHM